MNRIKELRKEKDIKQIDLCKQLGIVQGTLSGWENEKFEPDLESIKKMANIFECTIDYLLGNSDFRTHLDEELSQEEFALYGEVRELTTAEKEKIMEFIKFTKSIRKNNE